MKSATEEFSMLYKYVIHRNVQHGILITFAVFVSKVWHSAVTNRAMENLYTIKQQPSVAVSHPPIK